MNIQHLSIFAVGKFHYSQVPAFFCEISVSDLPPETGEPLVFLKIRGLQPCKEMLLWVPLRVIKNKIMRKSYFNSVKFIQCVLYSEDVLINLPTLNNPIR